MEVFVFGIIRHFNKYINDNFDKYLNIVQTHVMFIIVKGVLNFCFSCIISNCNGI